MQEESAKLFKARMHNYLKKSNSGFANRSEENIDSDEGEELIENCKSNSIRILDKNYWVLKVINESNKVIKAM